MKMRKLIKFYKSLGFIYGVVFTICLTSLVSIAATNIPGFAIFSQGGVISSSEINSNFEKVAGNIVANGTFTSTINITNANFVQYSDSPTSSSYRKKILFNSLTNSDSNLKTASDPEAATFSSSSGANFTYYEAPSNGWYEISIIPEFTLSVTNQQCSYGNCQYNLNGSINILMAKSFNQIKWSNSSIVFNNQSKYERDTDNNLTFDDSSNWDGTPPESKKIYLKTGQILYARLDAYLNQTNTSADFNINFPGSSTVFKIIKL